jgi:guanosine-3',5'-bis(diphosphate) 3'-pyrophosphohydrolase
MRDQLTTAMNIAFKAHEGQFDRGGVPYILHPIRIMRNMKTLDEKVVALLHDTVEDSDLTIEDLKKEGFSSEVLHAVDLMTHRKEDSYDEYLMGILTSPLACRVKLGDLTDNMDLKRLNGVTKKDLQRQAKYENAYALISKNL